MKSNKFDLRFNPVSLLILICFVLVNIPAQAALPPGKFQIRGIATDAETGKSIPYATVTAQNIHGIIKRLATDAEGKFSFALDSTGKYSVLVQSVGFKTGIFEVNIEDKTAKIDLGAIKLAPGTENIAGVSVTAQKPLIRTEVDKIVYNIEADPDSKTATALEMFRKLPMVTVDGEDNIQVKGSSNFKILLNGKSSSMLSQNPKDVLRSLPANSIRDIEVITNPSSKYDAEGTGGILNIITNKKQLDGFMARINAGVDTRGGYNGGIYATSKLRKFGFSVNYNYNDSRQPQGENYSYRENFLSQIYHYTESSSINNSKGKSNMAMGEASYEIDSLNLISLSFWGYTGDYNSVEVMSTHDFDTNHNQTREFLNHSTSANHYGNISGNIDYQRTFKKPDKSFTLSYKLEQTPRRTNAVNGIEGILNYDDYQQQSKNSASGAEHTFQMDYYNPVTKKHQVEGGVKYILRRNISNSDISRFDALQDLWIRDETRNNDLDYDQHIIGIYGGYVLKLKKMSIKTGIRVEGTINDGNFRSVKDTSFTNRMFNLIPYITLSENLGKGQNIRISYTQRLQRPGIYYLNPYRNDQDPLNISYGNPNLDAEISHTVDLSYGKFADKFNINLSLNGALVNNSINPVSVINGAGVRATTYKNIGKSQQFGSYANGSYRPGSKISINANLNINYALLESNDGRNLKNEGFNYSGFLNLRYTVWKNGTISGYAGLYSPRIMLQGKSSPYQFVGVNLSQELLKKKLTASVSISDPFREKVKYTSSFDDPTFRQNSTYLYVSRMIRFNLSYRFGELKGEIKKAKRGIKNEDLKGGGDNSGGSNGG